MNPVFWGSACANGSLLKDSKCSSYNHQDSHATPSHLLAHSLAHSLTHLLTRPHSKKRIPSSAYPPSSIQGRIILNNDLFMANPANPTFFERLSLLDWHHSHDDDKVIPSPGSVNDWFFLLQPVLVQKTVDFGSKSISFQQ